MRKIFLLFVCAAVIFSGSMCVAFADGGNTAGYNIYAADTAASGTGTTNETDMATGGSSITPDAGGTAATGGGAVPEGQVQTDSAGQVRVNNSITPQAENTGNTAAVDNGVITNNQLITGNNMISRAEIDEGIAFCEQFPVNLTLDGNRIIIGADSMPPLIVKERTLIPVRALFEAMGGNVYWDEMNRLVEITLGGSYVTLGIDSNLATVNGIQQTLEVPAMIIAKQGELYGSTMIPVRFTAEALGCGVDWKDLEREVVIASPEAGMAGQDPGTVVGQPNAATPAAISFWDPFGYEPLPVMNAAAARKLIAVDLGHGGKDTGSIGHEDKADELYEKTLNLKIGLYLRDYLLNAGANLYMIREDDRYFTLLERAEMANGRGADLFVSVHNNSSEYDWPTGTEVHYYGKIDAEGRDEKALYGIYSKDVAESVQKEMLKMLGTFDRGVKSSPKLAVLNKTVMPAIIIEGAFISNEENFEMMKTDEYARRYAYAVAKGLISVMNDTFK